MTAKKIFLVLYSLTLLGMSNADCYTLWGIEGHCVNIRKCGRFYELLKQFRGIPNESGLKVLSVLRTAHCGFEGREPKVCCTAANQNSADTTVPKSNSKSAIINKPSITTTTITTTTTTTTTPPPVLLPVEDHPNRRLLDEDSCGPITESRIYGGNHTSIYEFPWMALLGYHVGAESPEFRCGGSLISKRYVLTAAHCTILLPKGMELVNVRIGDYDLSSERDCDDAVGFNCAPRYQEFDIDRVHVHPRYSKKKSINDIALIRLNGEADMTLPNVRPICLPLGTAAVLKSPNVVVTGWGSTEAGVRSETLLKVTLPIMAIEKCREIYRRRFTIYHTQICAGGTYREDSCSGDSGGPLQATVVHDGKPRIVQYGIVSYGPESCGSDGFPGVYTSVPHFLDWILDQMTE